MHFAVGSGSLRLLCARFISFSSSLHGAFGMPQFRYSAVQFTNEEVSMKSIALMFLIVFILLTVTPVFAGDAAAGRDLFGKKCASCHGASGEGKDAIAKTFKVEMRNLGSKEV